MIKCICVDDSNKPSVIPVKNWVVKDNIYHIEYITYCSINKLIGVDLKEIYIPEHCSPYEYYSINRFAINENDLDKLKELIENCTGLDKINIEELTRELEINFEF